MRKYSLEKRADFYNSIYCQKWPDSKLHVETGNWMVGTWFIGNDYRNRTKLYGAYPPGYIDRVVHLFPDAKNILHLFAGSVEPGDYIRFDINKKMKPDIVGNAEELSGHFDKNSFDLIYADPPYSKEDAKKYGTKMPNRKKVIHECYKIAKPGCWLVWLDTVRPMYRKIEWQFLGTITIVRSTNHRVRAAFLFKKAKKVR